MHRQVKARLHIVAIFSEATLIDRWNRKERNFSKYRACFITIHDKGFTAFREHETLPTY